MLQNSAAYYAQFMLHMLSIIYTLQIQCFISLFYFSYKIVSISSLSSSFIDQQTITNSSTYVPGFWKTDQIVTLGLFDFIGPANGHTRTLHIHSVIARLGGLVCFSRASFADPVNS